MKKLIALGATAAAISMIAACGGGTSTSQSLIGKWAETEDGLETSIEFKEDGKLEYGLAGITIDGTYEIEDSDTVKINVSTWYDNEEPSSFTYKINGDTLSLTSDDGKRSNYENLKKQ